MRERESQGDRKLIFFEEVNLLLADAGGFPGFIGAILGDIYIHGGESLLQVMGQGGSGSKGILLKASSRG